MEHIIDSPSTIDSFTRDQRGRRAGLPGLPDIAHRIYCRAARRRTRQILQPPCELGTVSTAIS